MELIGIHQLLVLYMLHRAQEPLPSLLVTDFLLQGGYVDFLSLNETISALADNGYMEGTEVGDRLYFSITADGEQALAMFENHLTQFQKEDIEKYLKRNGQKLKRAREIFTQQYKATGGGYTAHMVLQEGNTTLAEINLNLPTLESAQLVCRNFEKQCDEVYAHLFQTLLSPTKPDSADTEETKQE